MTGQSSHRLQHHHRQGVKEKEGRLRQHTVTQDDMRELQWEQARNASSLTVIIIRDLLHFVFVRRFPQRRWCPFFPVLPGIISDQFNLAPASTADPCREHSCRGQYMDCLGRLYCNGGYDV